ncbi:MAG: hypothetical protein M1814_000760 [Vezdaea aestivalis]|nr:MAG: hypothetical protein M1814_000760 [Vezdaea aestivalis]
MDPLQRNQIAKEYRTLLASLSGSIVATTAVHPLDTLKSRVQANGFNYVKCVADPISEVGFRRAFYRGLAGPLATYALTRTLTLSVYQKSKYFISDTIQQQTGFSPLKHVNTLGSLPNWYTVFCFSSAGAISGAVGSVVGCPFELVKNTMQISPTMGAHKAKGNHRPWQSFNKLDTIGTFRYITKTQGWRGLYIGYKLHLIRDTVGTAIYFGTYESTKQLLATYRDLDSPTSQLAVSYAGATCGLTSYLCTYSMEVAKAIYQRERLSHSRGAQINVPSIGFFNRSLYRGIGVSMVRSVTSGAIFFSVFEYVKTQINNLE